MEDLDKKIIELMDLFDDEQVTTADKIDRPQQALDREAYSDFMKRNPMAGGGMLVQPGFGGTRQGYGGDRSEYIDYEARIKNPGKKKLAIAEKVHGNKPEYKGLKGFELWKKLETFQRSNITEGHTTGEAGGVGKLKKNQIGKNDFIKLVNQNKDKTYNEFVEIIKDYKTKDNKPFTKSIVADRLRAYKLSGSFKKEPSKGKDLTKKAETEKKRQEFLKDTDPTGAKGTKQVNYHHIRQIAGGVPLTTDDVMLINQRINSQLGGETNKALNRISAAIQKNNRLALEAMNSKEENLALEYMKRSDDLNAQAEKIVNSAIDKLPKKYKAYVGFNQFTLPRDEYGLPISNEPLIVKKVGGMPVSKDAIDLTDLNLKQEAEFKKLIRKQAETGKTGQIKGLAAFIKRNFPDGEIICNLSKGINCNNPQAYQKSINQLTQKAKQGDKAARSTLTRFTNLAGNAGKFIKGGLGPLAIASEIALEGGIALNKTLQTGVPFKTAFADSIFNLALGPKLQIDKEAELAKEFAKGEEFAMAERGRRMMIPQSATADAQRLKKREEEMKALYPQLDMVNLPNKQIDELLAAQGVYSPFTLGFGMQQKQPGIGDMRYNEDVAYDEIRDIFKKGAEEDIRKQQMQRIADAGGVANLAGGGIAKIAGDRSGAMLTSMNPDSQGLSGLLKRGIKT